MGRFRSLFDADEMKQLAIAAGVVETEEVAPAIAESPRRPSLLLDDDTPASSEASLNLQERPTVAPNQGASVAETPNSEGRVVAGSPESSGVRVFPVGDSYTVARPRLTSVSGDYPRVAVQDSANDSSLRVSGSDAAVATAESDTTADMAAIREVSSQGVPPDSDDGADDREARVRRLLIEYLSGEQMAVSAENALLTDPASTPLPAVVLDTDDASETRHTQGFNNESGRAGTDVGARPFLPSQGSVPVVAIEAATPESPVLDETPVLDSVQESTSPSGPAGSVATVASFDSSFTPAPPDPADTGIPAFDTPFRTSGPNTAVSSATAPAPLPGQDMLIRLGRPPLFTLLRASLLARVPWRAWQEQPWTQTHLCGALATVTGESEQFFLQEGAWRS